MPVVLTEADESATAILAEVIREYFPALARLDPPLDVRLLMAEDEKSVVPLKEHGRGVPATVKRSSREELASGGPDARILVDAMRWQGASDRRRAAILAEQVRRIEVVTYPDGRTPRTDDRGRYRLRLARYDWVLTGFRDVVDWFGDDAPARSDLKSVEAYLAQRPLPFGDDRAAVVARVAEVEADESRRSA